METLVGPGAVCDVISLRPATGSSSVNDKTTNDIIVLLCMSDAGNSVGPDPRAVVLLFIPDFRVYVGMSLILEHVWAGGG